MRRPFAVLIGLALAAASAWAQAPAPPAPMQSGTRAADRPVEPSAAEAPPSATAASLSVNQLFASSCGWCHAKGGREPGKGPKLMGTPLTDAEIVSRIRNGKPGQMPAFGAAFNDEQLQAIVGYIRELQP